MTSPVVGFPLETVYTITNISRSMPCVVTIFEVERDHTISVANQQTITISKVQGMPQINGLRFTLENLDTGSKTFTLKDLFGLPFDSTGFSAYVSGGQIDIVSFPGNPPGLMYNNE